ncbi:secreted RxLR effector protein 78-like [Capsicum annuum]|uniref:secreted RxLR effector protein 78-like n=1 Tax=Capsicum annuum TaxID=4072 RepID=UPI001FB05E60|nr:secreted RxLR effector protein 78-like [Capsicum annuum]
MVLKLDMMKAYDRVGWIFLTKFLRKMGFSEILIDMVFRLLENNWYSILLNGKPKGFFKSSRGLKQGDPLSPTLFIIAAEVLSINLKKLMLTKEFRLFGMPRGSPKLNHLAFADDMIILCKAEMRTLQMVSSTLEGYEVVSGQKINKGKSALYIH